jgi:PIN domain nuclease of toxin-antitoxin system
MRRYLADTHAALWWFGGAVPRLGRAARRVFQQAEAGGCEVILSVISLWEIGELYDSGRLRLPAGYVAWCDELEKLPGFRFEPLTRPDVDCARALRGLRDPADRLIAGTAVRLQVPLLTADARIVASRAAKVVWD